MLSLSLDEVASSSPRSRLAAATRGVVFFATPHFGSRLASLGLKLRHVPGAARAPAPAVHHLAPGPHLELLNERLRSLHAAGAWRPAGYICIMLKLYMFLGLCWHCSPASHSVRSHPSLLCNARDCAPLSPVVREHTIVITHRSRGGAVVC